MPSYSFLRETQSTPQTQDPIGSRWKILIVDDEEDVHKVTVLSLSDFEFDGRGVEFIHAHSAQDAKSILLENDDLALVLLDVVMESRNAGLVLAKWIRAELKNRKIRIVLRTGQPGDAPENEVISEYDINDYKEKSELTAKKLYTLTCAALRSYRDIDALIKNEKGLNKIIEATSLIFQEKSLRLFAEGVLEQIFALYYVGHGIAYKVGDGFAMDSPESETKIIASIGRFKDMADIDISSEFGVSIFDVLKQEGPIINLGEARLAIILNSSTQGITLLFLEGIIFEKNTQAVTGLLELFVANVNAAYENLTLNNELDESQREIAYLLGEAIEARSREPSHLRIVAQLSEILALRFGLTPSQATLIKLASPLRNIGKISIPDHILEKQGKLNADERDILESHAKIGEEMLSGSNSDAIKIASLIAGNHRERWDGGGYPQGLKSEAIPIEARITMVADAFDTLLNERRHKESWSLDKVVAIVKSERGKHFDPDLIDTLLNNLHEFLLLYEDTSESQ